jgi:small subunit ribosomal protein S2
MKTISLEELLEAGCHFGHQVTRQNPKARDYIFEARDGVHIIDLEKTKEGLEDAARFIKEVAKKGGTLLVLGTKRQAEGILRDEIKRISDIDPVGIHFVIKRWIGGTLTNYAEVSKNFKRLKDLSARLEDDYEKSKYTKKEIGDWEKEKQKLLGFYGAAVNMAKTPDALFIIDTHLERVAAHEATRMGIPTVGITDTNADPTIINYPIPANDDAVGSLKLIISYVMDAWLEGREQYKKGVQESAVKAEKEKAAEAARQAKATKAAETATSTATVKAAPAKAAPAKEPEKKAPTQKLFNQAETKKAPVTNQTKETDKKK